MKKLKILLVLNLALGPYLLFGQIPMRILEVDRDSDNRRKRIYPKVELKVGVSMLSYKFNLGKKIQTIDPIDPCPTETLTTDLDKECVGAFVLGLAVSIGTEKIRLKIGLDTRYNVIGKDEGYRGGFCDIEKVPNPPPYESYVFTQLVTSSFTHIPFIGFEIPLLKEELTFSVKLGFPYMKFRAFSGNDWWSNWIIYQKDFWKGYGKSIHIDLFYTKDSTEIYGFSAGLEIYRPKFLGEKAKIYAYTLNFSFNLLSLF